MLNNAEWFVLQIPKISSWVSSITHFHWSICGDDWGSLYTTLMQLHWHYKAHIGITSWHTVPSVLILYNLSYGLINIHLWQTCFVLRNTLSSHLSNQRIYVMHRLVCRNTAPDCTRPNAQHIDCVAIHFCNIRDTKSHHFTQYIFIKSSMRDELHEACMGSFCMLYYSSIELIDSANLRLGVSVAMQ